MKKFFSLLFLNLLLLGCQSSPPEVVTGAWEIRTLSAEPLTQIAVTAEVVGIETIGLSVYGKLEGKVRNYYSTGATPLYRVEYGPGEWKLYSKDQLRWIMKFTAEEWSLGTREGVANYTWQVVNSNLTLKENGSIIREVTLDADQYLPVAGYQVRGLSASPGLLLLRNIDDLERYILMAEIYASGK